MFLQFCTVKEISREVTAKITVSNALWATSKLRQHSLVICDKTKIDRSYLKLIFSTQKTLIYVHVYYIISHYSNQHYKLCEHLNMPLQTWFSQITSYSINAFPYTDHSHHHSRLCTYSTL